jgi:hypothetical protein
MQEHSKEKFSLSYFPKLEGRGDKIKELLPDFIQGEKREKLKKLMM